MLSPYPQTSPSLARLLTFRGSHLLQIYLCKNTCATLVMGLHDCVRLPEPWYESLGSIRPNPDLECWLSRYDTPGPLTTRPWFKYRVAFSEKDYGADTACFFATTSGEGEDCWKYRSNRSSSGGRYAVGERFVYPGVDNLYAAPDLGHAARYIMCLSTLVCPPDCH